MLTSLSIKNFALIEDVNLQLQDQFTIITGETGAGKSILLGALSLLLGKRADLSAIRSPEKKCVVEGVFQIENYHLQSLFENNDLDYEPQTIIRREILPSGKSRAFINDTPATLQKLSLLGNQLVDIHSQHETLFVGDVNYQFQVIDALANHKDLLQQYRKSYKNYQRLLQQLAKLKEEQREAAAAYDYNLFLLNELREAELKEGIQEELETQYQELNNVEELKENLSAAAHQLQQEEIGGIFNLQEVKNRLNALRNYGEQYQSLSERIESVLIEVEDMAVEIERLENKVEADPETLDFVNDKLQQLYNLQKKHHLDSEQELMQLQQELEEKVATSENAEEEISALTKKIEAAKKQTQQLAKSIYNNRKKVIPHFIKSVQEILTQVGMPDAQLKVDLKHTEDFSNNGADQMQWLLAANKGGNFNEMRKAASGGELSRITLAIKSILAKYSKLPTIIFDEIDTGVSGDIAQKMAVIMSHMGKEMQVLSITHLPQIAAKGNHHFKVYKETEGNTTKTNIVELKGDTRVEELAEMLGGKDKSASAIAHAKELLN
ncbi:MULTISPECIES: DNA repair protein RecN [Mesonia]|uniref:DNA repair protein RecN n=1 Tax=Mesonia oceanica TaxID=2687242 RepID=A0AC61YC61_9FLAO|nr:MULTISPECIES: DNA repair protein RecN [Mesonia]MAN29287.1 DNA repair protein RecN [Mesonia sp.]MAQ39889.1 DNA repair protein RecN [Mesonia sp.]MBJ99023.1 DNA repair protein RecN [Flavobacteriaceae bacterium]VVV02066.1 DNA repair protein RecN [Mesonia oceanica]